MFRPRMGCRLPRPHGSVVEMLGDVRRASAQTIRFATAVRTCPTNRRRFIQVHRVSYPATPVVYSRTMATARPADGRLKAQQHPQPTRDLPNLDRVVALVSGAQKRLLDHPGVPSEEETATALRICAEAANLIMDGAVQPQLSSIDHLADTSASTLLSLDSGKLGQIVKTPAPTEASPRLRQVVRQIADAAFAIIQDPRVTITLPLLEQYVAIQARLGRPESLPRVLELYASKSLPQVQADSRDIRYIPQNPRRAAAAVPAEVAEQALDAALATRDLDAAVGVVEGTYAAPAFVRSKLLRRGLLPAMAVVGVPLATYSVAQQLAAVQQTLDDRAVTGMAFAAILAYVGFTGAIGVVASATANDQMRRVTWSPGTPLRERWLREEERAALDKVTCAFGFSDAHRYGEEEGADFQALREYAMRKGMLVDQIEMIEGMS